MAFLNISTKRPDKHKDLEAWNASWEKDLKIWNSFTHTPPDLFLQDANSQEFTRYMDSRFVAIIDQLRDEIVHLQADVRAQGLVSLATKDFSAEWRGLGPDKRKKIVLEALYKTSSTGPDMDDRRKWCPEAIVDYLAQDGQKYLELLTLLVEPDANADQTTEVIFFPHPVVDRVLQIIAPQGNTMGTMMRIDRTYYMTLTIWNIFLACYSIKELSRFYYLKQQPETQKALREAKKKVFATAEERDTYRRKLRQFREDNKGRETRYCWGCGKSQALLPPDTLKACGRCMKIDRVVYYCSKECQTNDWKHGVGQPHKIICGKPFEKPLEIEVYQEITKMIPPPDMSFKRPAALQYQISLLKKDPKPDYYLVPKHPFDDICVALSDSGSQLFVAWRHQAFKNGDSSAVAAMFLSLKSFVSGLPSSLHYDMEDLKRQLEAEYRVKITVDGDLQHA